MEYLNKFKTFAKEHFVEIFFAVVLVLIIVFILYWNHCESKHIYNQIMEGLWIASDDFCARSGIDGMLIFIGPSSGNMRKAYIIIFSDNKIAVNEQFKIYSDIPLIFIPNREIKHNAEMEGEKILKKIIPEKIQIILDIGNGRMIWEKDDIRYAELFKDTLSVKSSLPDDLIASEQPDDSDKL